jgi:hypothetical protein
VGISPASLQNRCVYSVYSNRSDGSCARFTWPRRTHIPPGPLASALAGKMPIRRRSFPRAARALRGFSLLQALAATWRAAAFPERAFGLLQGQSLGRDSPALSTRRSTTSGSSVLTARASESFAANMLCKKGTPHCCGAPCLVKAARITGSNCLSNRWCYHATASRA